MAIKIFVGGNWKCSGTTEEVKKIVTTLNEADVPSDDVVEFVEARLPGFSTELLGSQRWCFYWRA